MNYFINDNLFCTLFLFAGQTICFKLYAHKKTKNSQRTDLKKAFKGLLKSRVKVFRLMKDIGYNYLKSNITRLFYILNLQHLINGC